MNNTNQTTAHPLAELPGRLFLDSSTLQALLTYGEYIYDGGVIETADRLWAIPNGFENIEALRKIMFVGRRALFELVISDNSLKEVSDRGRVDYLMWAYELLDYWQSKLAQYEDSGQAPYTGAGTVLAEKLKGDSFGYLSRKDALVIRDSILLECQAFITMDRKLAKNHDHIERELKLKVLEPVAYWKVLEPYARLFI